MVSRDGGERWGTISYRPEGNCPNAYRLAIALLSCYSGRGIGGEAIGLLLEHLFEGLAAERVGLEVREYDVRAVKLYERMGFVHEGAKRHACFHGGRYHDLIVMGLLRGEWDASRSRSTGRRVG